MRHLLGIGKLSIDEIYRSIHMYFIGATDPENLKLLLSKVCY